MFLSRPESTLGVLDRKGQIFAPRGSTKVNSCSSNDLSPLKWLFKGPIAVCVVTMLFRVVFFSDATVRTTGKLNRKHT